MQYPGRSIRAGETDTQILAALAKALNKALALGLGDPARLPAAPALFDADMARVVRLFQTRNLDSSGAPLKPDGKVGPLTWAALFGDGRVAVRDAARGGLLRAVLAVAAGEEAKAVREQPRNSNRGPEVDAYLRSAAVPPGLAWCCAFVYWCFQQAAQEQGRSNPMFRTAGCLMHWNKAESVGARRVPAADARANPALLQPGMVFIMDYGSGLGHTGLVESVQGGYITTIEGNTDASQTREGGGVYRLQRKILDINKGFIDYAGR